MVTIVPRWEWRTFGESFGDADRLFPGLSLGPPLESDELYFLSPHGDANVKVRAELMDIKALEQVDAGGLEQWKPVMKAAFPLPDAETQRVFAALGVAPPPRRDAYDLDTIRAELTHPSRGVRAVAIHKKRRRFTIAGCQAEMTELTADGRATRTVALESEAPARVRAAVQEMGLEGFENLSYPRGLKRLLALSA
jgi:exopolyphosphatase/guanosine-5'-triphosphate,3'-diphosphate pyrophosphatase